MRPSRADNAWGDRRWWRGPVLLLLLVVLTLQTMACAGRGLRPGRDGRFHNDDPEYAIDAPRFSAEALWKRISLEGTDLAWRTADGRSMSLSSSCKQTRARPALLARRLLIGVPRDDLLSAHPVALRGDPGWAQIVETGKGTEAVRIKTVTVVSAGCVFDWVLVAGAGARFDESLDAFDDWWSSFERGGRDAAPALADETGEPETEASPEPPVEEAAP